MFSSLISIIIRLFDSLLAASYFQTIKQEKEKSIAGIVHSIRL